MSGVDIDDNLTVFINLMDNICDPLFARQFNTCNMSFEVKPNNSNKQPWFDQECVDLRRQFYNKLDNFRLNRNTENQNKLSQTGKNFKHIIQRKRFEYDKLKTEKLIVSRKSNVKEYWKMLKCAANIDTKSSIKSDTFSEYF